MTADTHTLQCVCEQSTAHTACRLTERLTTTTLLSGVPLVKKWSAMSKEAKTSNCKTINWDMATNRKIISILF